MKLKMLGFILIALMLVASSASAAEIVIKIGVVGPLTGDFASGGHQQLYGAQLAAEEINAAEAEANGNIRIELIREDDASIVDQSVSATIRLITRENIHALLGAFNSPATLAIVPVTARYRVPQYTVGVGTAITQQNSDYIFRMAPAAPLFTRELADFAVNEMEHRQIAIAYTQDEYGETCANAFKTALAEMGLEPVMMEPWTLGTRDYTGLLTRIRQTPATAIYLTGAIADYALIVRQMRQFGMDIQVLGDMGMADPRYIELAGSAAEGTVVVEPFNVDADIPVVTEFVNAFSDAFNLQATSWAAEMYDAVYLIYQAVKEAGDVSREIIAEYTRNLNEDQPFEGVMGRIFFDDTGEPTYEMYKVQVIDGKKVIVGFPGE